MQYYDISLANTKTVFHVDLISSVFNVTSVYMDLYKVSWMLSRKRQNYRGS